MPQELVFGSFVAAGPRTLSLTWKRGDDANDPDFAGCIVWATTGASLTPSGTKVGEGNCVATSSMSPITWDADPNTDYTVSIAGYDRFPVVVDQLNKLEVS